MLFIIDTNSLVSAILNPERNPALALAAALANGSLVFSEETKEELLTVIQRTKFDKYGTLSLRMENVNHILASAKLISAKATPDILCRDNSDIKFLSLALQINADCIISGDSDLKELHPFRGIPILSPREFLNWNASK